jgi:hypothetical protein
VVDKFFNFQIKIFHNKREGRKAETTTKKKEEERLKQSFRRGALRERVERERSF